MKRRDWSQAQHKRTACRVCGTINRVELAHVIGREFDEQKPGSKVFLVKPERVVPLCGPATDSGTCHGAHHRHTLDLLPYLQHAEVVQAVDDVGLENARIRLLPSAYDQQTKVAV